MLLQVIEVDAEELEVKFLLKDGTHYIWPTKEDIAWIPCTDILGKLSTPQLLPGRGLKMSFMKDELDQILKVFSLC